MAINLMACTCIGLIQLSAEELVENLTLQELLEEEQRVKKEYTACYLSLQHPQAEEKVVSYFNSDAAVICRYELDIHVPPPNFFPTRS